MSNEENFLYNKDQENESAKNASQPENPKMNQRGSETKRQNEWHDHADTDKYLAMEQPGVTFTDDAQPTNYSDYPENGELSTDTWSADGGNSRNSDAFNQDDYLLSDNVDLDEDQNTSISSEDNDK